MNVAVFVTFLVGARLLAASKIISSPPDSWLRFNHRVSTYSTQDASLDHLREQGFAPCVVCGKLGAMRPKLGDILSGKLQKPSEEQKVIDLVRQLVTKHGIEVNYLLDGPAYLVDHAFPLLHVLPGTYWTLRGAIFPANKVVPASIPLKTTTALALRRLVEAKNKKRAMILTWTAQEGAFNNLAGSTGKIATLPHGDDEDLQWYTANGFEETKILQRPFQDMAYSNYMTNNRYTEPEAVAGWLRTKLEQKFVGSPCHQRECRGVVLLSLPGNVQTAADTRKRVNCKVPDEIWKPLVEDWNLMVSFSPTCLHPDTHNLPSSVYVNDDMMGLRIQDLIAESTVLVTSSAGLLSMIGGEFSDKPVVRIPPIPERLSALSHSVWNSSMSIIHPAFDSGLAGAVQSALDQMGAPGSKDAVLAARKEYQERYMWRVDGFEEYRNALALLSLVVPSDDDLMELTDAVKSLTSITFRPQSLYQASYDMGMLSWSPSQIMAARKLDAQTAEVWNRLQRLESANIARRRAMAIPHPSNLSESNASDESNESDAYDESNASDESDAFDESNDRSSGRPAKLTSCLSFLYIFMMLSFN